MEIIPILQRRREFSILDTGYKSLTDRLGSRMEQAQLLICFGKISIVGLLLMPLNRTTSQGCSQDKTYLIHSRLLIQV